jgi:hypothetical protein
MIELLSWRAIFWINIPLIALTVALTLRAVEESRDPEAFRGIDPLGILLSAVGLGGPVFALIEQPTKGWGDPLVWIPMAVGIACLVTFVLREARLRHPMLDLALFRIRNFWVANLTTLTAYAGLIAGLFFLTLFLQQVVGYSALEAGLATTPDSLLLFALSSRFGRIASEIGPRLPMSVGPIVGGFGLLLLLRVGADADYVTEVLPAVVVFGLGLAMTVAPLTATVLDSVEERHAGIASGINNAVARVAGLMAIAVLGALISASFASTLDSNLGDRPLGREAGQAVADAKEQPLAVPPTEQLAPAEAERVRAASADASTSGFHLGILIAGLLMIAGGAVAGWGIENPRRPIEAVPAGASATAGECGHGLDADCAPEERVGKAPAPEPA